MQQCDLLRRNRLTKVLLWLCCIPSLSSSQDRSAPLKAEQFQTGFNSAWVGTLGEQQQNTFLRHVCQPFPCWIYPLWEWQLSSASKFCWSHQYLTLSEKCKSYSAKNECLPTDLLSQADSPWVPVKASDQMYEVTQLFWILFPQKR